MAPRRLPPPPGSSAGAVGFRWGRRALAGKEGDTVASALVAAGEGVLSRSIKYHRPRGFLCGVGKCANCLCTIDGRPSRKACLVPLRLGMRVEPQNAWPSPRRDLFGLADKVFARGFDPQRSFTRPAFLRPFYYDVVRRMAGLGKAPRDARPPAVAEVAKQRVPLAVVGGGPAGLAAAWEASRAGLEVAVLDEMPWPGGRLAQETGRVAGPDAFAGQTPPQVLGALLKDLRARGAAPRQQANVAGIYGDRLLAVQTPARLAELRAEAVVLATGAPESMPLFHDNDRPGIMAASGAMLLLHRHGVLPGERVVIAGQDPRALDLGRALAAKGAQVEAVVGPGVPGGGEVRTVRGAVRRALGGAWVEAVEVEVGGEVQRLACDLLVYTDPRRPAVELAQQAGARLAWRGGVQVPEVGPDLRTTAGGVFACGDLLGPSSIEAALASGRVAGLRAAQALGGKVDEQRLASAEDAWAAMRGAP